MNPWLTTARLDRLFWGVAVGAVGISVGLLLPVLSDLSAQFLVLAATFMVTITLGELWRVSFMQARDLAPLSLAASLAIAMTAEQSSAAALSPTAGVIVLVAAAGTVAGSYLYQWRTGIGVNWQVITVRVIVVTATVVMFRWVSVDGMSLAEWKATWDAQLWMVAGIMLVVAGLAVGLHIFLSSLERAVRTHGRLRSVISHEVAALTPLLAGVASTAVVIPLAVRPLGPVAVPLFLIPLGLLHLAVVRQNAASWAQRQTIYALSRLTEQGGLTAVGHAERVGRMAVRIGRVLGLPERELVDLEYAGLLHDLGQVALRRPIPGGATVHTAPLDQRRIAAAGSSILARTVELSRLAPAIADQATAFHRLREAGVSSQAGSILRVANAYDDLTGAPTRSSTRAVTEALERLRLGVGHEYDPTIVRALCLVLIRDGHLRADQLDRYAPR